MGCKNRKLFPTLSPWRRGIPHRDSSCSDAEHHGDGGPAAPPSSHALASPRARLRARPPSRALVAALRRALPFHLPTSQIELLRARARCCVARHSHLAPCRAARRAGVRRYSLREGRLRWHRQGNRIVPRIHSRDVQFFCCGALS